MSALAAAAALYRRDVRLAWADGGGAAAPLGFFAGATTLLPLAVGTDPALLARIGPALLWVTGALSVLMTLERLFQADLEDGALDQLMLSAAPLELLALAKGAALWTAVGAPLALLALPLAIALQAPPSAAPAIALGLAIGMAGFIGSGLLAAGLSAGVRRGGVLIAVLVLPFFAPIIIFGANAAAAAAASPFGAAFTILAGLSLGAAALGPIGASFALRLHAE
jgi:heme exporter protein B